MNPTGPLVVLRLNMQPSLAAYATSVSTSLTGNAKLPNPNPTLVVFNGHVATLVECDNAPPSKVAGAVAARKAAAIKVRQDLYHLRDYVQSVVETQVSVADAIAIIQSANMFVRQPRKRNKPVLAVTDGIAPGSVVLVVQAGGRKVTYYWQYSGDQKTWSSAPETMVATTTITGLASVQVWYFRFRTLTSKGAGEYSQIVSHLVK